MNLDILAGIPDDEKSVLLVGEDHNAPVLEEMLELLNTYKPDAIGIEMRHTQKAVDGLDNTRTLSLFLPHTEILEPKHFGMFPGGRLSAGNVALVYAIWNKIPLYFMDWQPCSPGSVENVLGDFYGKFTYDEMGAAMKHTLKEFFNVDMDMEHFNEHQFQGLMILDWTMPVRNEWSAMALNEQDENRFLYVAGNEHFCDNIDVEEYTSMQLLVDAPHRYIANMKALGYTDDIIERVDQREEFKLPWEMMDYMEAEQ